MLGWQGHLFFLHLALGLLLSAPLLDVAGLLLRREALLHAGRWNTLVGLAAALVAAAAGLAAEADLPVHTPAADALLSLHRTLAWWALAGWAPVGVWRASSKLALPRRMRTAYLALSFAACGLLFADASVGHAAVFRHGLGLRPGSAAPPPIGAGRVPLSGRDAAQ